MELELALFTDELTCEGEEAVEKHQQVDGANKY
jgi:hypothetical protein